MIVSIRRQGAEPRTVTVAGAEAVLGKQPDCQVVLADSKVSRRHARLFERDGRVFVEDLGSTNGTLVAGRAIEGEMPLADGAAFENGPFELSVSPSADTSNSMQDRTAAVPILTGLGPLDPLFADDSVSEIMVNGPQEILVERRGAIEPTDMRFASGEALRELIVKIAADAGRVIDDRQPLLDARLRDGSRVNAVLRPLAVSGPYLTIRRFPSRRLGAEQLVENGSLSPAMLALLRSAVSGRISILVSGGTGTGKTTLLAALSSSPRASAS